MNISHLERGEKHPEGYSYSFLSKMREEGKITREFELILSNISLEDLIALKLESSSSKMNGLFYKFPLMGSLSFIIEEAVIRFAFSVAPNLTSALNILGITMAKFRELQKSHRVEDVFFNEEKKFNLSDVKQW